MESLQLSDIIHTASPEPHLVQDSHDATHEHDSPEPEPLAEAQIIEMRRRVVEIASAARGQADTSPREQELVEMVIRLTESTLADPSQLMNQAATISGLTAQRNYLVRQVEEERVRWLSEKDGWERMAEALIAQRIRPSTIGLKDADVERNLSADNRILRDKLHDAQSRLSSLESELTKLRPILIMQPFASSSRTLLNHAPSVFSTIPYPSLHPSSSKLKIKKKKQEPRNLPCYKLTPQDTDVDIDITVDQAQTSEPPLPDHATSQASQVAMEGVESTFTTVAAPSSAFFQFQAAPAPPLNVPKFSGDHYRKPQVPSVGGPLTAPPTTLQFQLMATDPDPSHSPAPGSQPQTRPLSRQVWQPSLRSLASADMMSMTPPAFPPSPLRRSKARRSHRVPPAPLTSDARAEHLLLAARKIGKQRAAILAGIVREREQERLDEEKDPGTIEGQMQQHRGGMTVSPARAPPLSPYYRDIGQAGGILGPQTPSGRHQYLSPHTSFSNLVSSSAATPLMGQSRSIQQVQGSIPPIPIMRSPLKSHSTIAEYQEAVGTPRQECIDGTIQPGQPIQTGSGQGRTTTPSTPLSSLLDAARMMDRDRKGAGPLDPASATGEVQGLGKRRGTKAGRGGGAESHQDGAIAITNGTRTANGRASRASTANSASTATGSGAAGPTSARRRAAAAVEQPASPPAPKRRRVSTARALASREMEKDQQGRMGEIGEGKGRMRSALDVLADQAAAAVGQDGKGNGKGRVKESEVLGEGGQEQGRARTGRGRGRTRIHSSSQVQVQGKVKVRARVKKQKEEEQSKPEPKMKAPRPPPRFRGTASLPAADNGDNAPTDVSTSVAANASISRSRTVVVMPRMISPPVTRTAGQRETAEVAPYEHNDEMAMSPSPLDILPSSGKDVVGKSHPSGSTAGDGPPSSLQQPCEAMGETAAVAVGVSPKFGFRPVTRWTAEEEGSEEGRLLTGPIGARRASGEEGLGLKDVGLGGAEMDALERIPLPSPARFIPPTGLDRRSSPTLPLRQKCPATATVRVDSLDGENAPVLPPSPAKEEELKPEPRPEGLQEIGIDNLGVHVPTADGHRCQVSVPDDGSDQVDVEMQGLELPLAVTEAVALPEGEEAPRGAEELLVIGSQDASEMKAPGDHDIDDDAEVDADAEAGPVEHEAEGAQGGLNAEAYTSREEPIVNEIRASPSNKATLPSPPPVPGVISNQSPEPEFGHHDAGDCGNADDSDADAEGEVDVDAEGEIDSEVESPTIISPSLARLEPGTYLQGHSFEIASPAALSGETVKDSTGSSLTPRSQEAIPTGNDREECDVSRVADSSNEPDDP